MARDVAAKHITRSFRSTETPPRREGRKADRKPKENTQNKLQGGFSRQRHRHAARVGKPAGNQRKTTNNIENTQKLRDPAPA